MHYEINVALNGRHYFATAAHSIRDKDQAEKVYKDFQVRFPESEGFSAGYLLGNCREYS